MNATSKKSSGSFWSEIVWWRVLLMALPLVVWALPLSIWPFPMTLVEHRMLAILIFAVIFWVLEPIPLFATSMALILVLILTISDSALLPLRQSQPNLGVLVSYKEFLHTLASPAVMLFIGGFFLAGAASKYSLDRNLARILVKPLGQRSSMVLLGIMGVTCFFSFWMANTPTTAMMLSIAAPIIALYAMDDPGRVAMLLGIPIASSLGGIGTPVGTAMNAIGLKYMPESQTISFLEWCSLSVPFSVIMTLLSWGALVSFFPAKQRNIEINLAGVFDKSVHAKVVYWVFPLTILFWLTSEFHGINIYSVALFPVVVFLATGVITKNDMKKMSWDVLWLIAGGFALGAGLEGSGLIKTLIKIVPFQEFNAVSVVILGGLVTLGVATVMSHLASANLLIPIMAAVAPQIQGLGSIGGVPTLLYVIAVNCSLGMALPISTPCNALAFAAGGVTNKDMMKAGGFVSVVGFILLMIGAFFLRTWS